MSLKQQGYPPKSEDYRNRDDVLSCHMREWNILHILADGNLSRKTKNCLVYSELHTKLDHLGVD